MTNSASRIVEDLFLTDSFLIKGRMPNKSQRLTNVLEAATEGFLYVEDAAMISLQDQRVIRTPSVQVNTRELVLAHELVDIAGDNTLRNLASDDQKTHRIRAFYSGVVGLELSGRVEPRAYEPAHNEGRRFFIMRDPVLHGLDLDSSPEFRILKSLSYVIVQKSRLAYVYDFS